VGAEQDQADVERVLSGETSAFEAIVRRWQGPLINLAYRFCRDRGRAEDMAQEAFLRAYRALGGWRKEAAFSTWLIALATNVYRSELRRIPPDALRRAEKIELHDDSAAAKALEDANRAQVVRQAVASLPPKYRDVLVLFYFHEMDVPDTAVSLALPEGTVKARLWRGRELLRRKLMQLSESPAKGESHER